MGEKLLNFHVRSNSEQDVARVISNIIRTEAYISPSKNGWVTIYDEMTEYASRHEEIVSITSALSEELSTAAIAFVVLSGIHFLYYLYDQGEMVDEFHDSPDIYPFGFNEGEGILERFQGRPEVVLRYCPPTTSLQQIVELLEAFRGREPDYLGLGEPYRLASLLGIDADRAILGFVDFEADNLQSNNPLLEDAEDFIHVSTSGR